jgi:two-component system sensor histidine kinase MprB
VRAVAAGTHGAYFVDVTVQSTHLRMYVAPVAAGAALQIVRPLTEVDSVLGRIGVLLGVVAACGIALAALLGWIVAREALIPVRRLTEATEHVTETHDLSSRIEVDGRDELSRLAVSFNRMLGELEESEGAQRALVADASHELRTPLTSIRTNVEVLARSEGALSPEEREQTFRDVVDQLAEMGVLIDDLLSLARGQQPSRTEEDVRLDLVAADLAERYGRRAPGLQITTHLEESLVRGDPAGLERAVGNLLDNAVKWSPEGSEIEVTVHGAEVAVRDHGPGIAPEDAPHVFDRFYRAPAARGLPGSGLGLAIVKQVADAHGGSVAVEAPAGGGALVRLRLLPDS